MLRNWLKKLQDSTDLENRRVILDLLEPNESARLLDLGCGDGSFTLELGRKIGTEQLYGVEAANEFIGQPEKRGVQTYIADLNEPLPLDDESFDVVHSNQVIEHLYKTDSHLREIHRILKTDGYAIISTPNLAAIYTIFFLILGLQPLSVTASDEVYGLGNRFNPWYRVKRERNYPAHAHLRVFTYTALKELVQYHGFKVERIVGVGYYPFSVRVGRLISLLDPRHTVYLTVKARKAV